MNHSVTSLHDKFSVKNFYFFNLNRFSFFLGLNNFLFILFFITTTVVVDDDNGNALYLLYIVLLVLELVLCLAGNTKCVT